MLRFINGHVLLPVLEKLTKRDVLKKLKSIREFESKSLDEQLMEQRASAYHFLQYCQESIPFYQDLFSQNGFDIKKIKKDIDYIKQLPVLTKQIVRENCEKIKAQDGRRLHVRKTGGSTGQSAYFFYDNYGLDWSAAFNLFSYEMAGKKLHHTDCHMGADLDFGKPNFKNGIIDKIRMAALNRQRLQISTFDNIELQKMYLQLKKYKPFLLQGHPSSVYALANYIEANQLPLIKLCDVFEPSGEMLSQKMVERIEKNIFCKVTNRYGNAEFGVLAHSRMVDSFNKLKVFLNAFFVESGENQPLIVSNFTNSGFPLLRYDTGDIGSVRQEKDGVFIHSIAGRIHDVFCVNDKAFPTHYLMDYLDHKVGGIREFQVELNDSQKKPILKIVPEDTNDILRIKSAIEIKWPTGLDIVFIDFNQLVLQGWRQKFKHLIDLRKTVDAPINDDDLTPEV